jgi:hypothetical protein
MAAYADAYRIILYADFVACFNLRHIDFVAAGDFTDDGARVSNH